VPRINCWKPRWTCSCGRSPLRRGRRDDMAFGNRSVPGHFRTTPFFLLKPGNPQSRSRGKLMRRVVVTGMGMVTPLGTGIEHVWGRLRNGESGIRRIEHIEAGDLKAKIAGIVPRGAGKGELNAEAFVNSKEHARIDDFILYAIAAAQEALEDSGYVPESEESREMAGVVIGSGIGGIGTISANTQAMLQKGTKR